MVERSRRGKGKRRLLGNHQKSWLWGRHAVLETLRAGKWTVHDLLLSEELSHEQRDEARLLVDSDGTRVEVVSTTRLQQTCHSSEHQGYVARMAPFPYTELEAIWPEPETQWLCVVCDRLQDPHNFGALVRSAEALGADAVLVATAEQVGVSSHVARSSAGAVNHIPIVQTNELVPAVEHLQRNGVLAVACSEKADRSLSDCDLTRSLMLIVGNEGRGIRQELLACADEHVTIPLSGQVASLNATVAAGIALYEVSRQRATR